MFVLEWALPLIAILAISSTGANLGKFEELDKPAKVFSRQVEHDLPLDNRLDIKATKVKGLQESVTFKVGTKRQQQIEDCVWTSPHNEISQGKIEPKTNCSLVIESVEDNDLGIWNCKVKLKGVEQYQVGIVTLSLPNQELTNVRLPSGIRPLHYRVELTPFIEEHNFTIAGKVTIEMVASVPTNRIVLHAKDMTIHESEVAVDQSAKSVTFEVGGFSLLNKVVGHGYDQDRDFYMVFLDNEMTGNLTLTIPFTGKLNDGLDGFYRSSYKDAKGQTVWMGTTQFESISARKAFPCFDEPDQKAVFRISLGRIPTMKSISNMPQTETGVARGDGYVWDHYQDTEVMSTYLLAFVVCDFESRPGLIVQGSPTKFGIWTRKSKLDETVWAARVGPKVLHFYEDFFGIDFPLPKQDMIGIPDFSAGAMENWGLITYRETAILYSEGVSSLAEKERVAQVIAHELAHQWFGDLVTMKWWTDLWLNEGFANFVENYGVDFVMPEARYLERFPVEHLHSAMSADQWESTHPISVQGIESPKQIESLFDDITYQKGSSIIRMMASFLGMENFKAGVTDYLNAHKYGNAEQDDLWEALNDVVAKLDYKTLPQGKTVKEVMDTWTLQPGYPVISAKRHGKSEVEVSQKRFLIYQENKTSEGEQFWWTPISVEAVTKGEHFNDTRPKCWSYDSASMCSFDGQEGVPYLLNSLQAGFYRVNYDAENWAAIAKALETQTLLFPPITRSQLVSDALSLARAGLLDYDLALDMTKYLATGEFDYIPWKAAMRQLNTILYKLEAESDYDKIRDYYIKSLSKTYKHLGFNDKEDDEPTTILLRPMVVSKMCHLGQEDCIAWALEKFGLWQEKGAEESAGLIPSGLKGLVYCQGVKHGGQKEWDLVWDRMVETNDQAEEGRLRGSLACTKEPWLLKKLLDRIVEENSKIRSMDSFRAIESVAGNLIGADIAWRFTRENWDRIMAINSNSKGGAAQLLQACVSGFKTQTQLDEFEVFVNAHRGNFLPRDIQKSRLKIKSNMEWMQKHQKKVVQWLAKH